MLSHPAEPVTRPTPAPNICAPSPPYARITVRLVVALAALVITVWLVGTPSGILGKADAVGYAICHRIESRTYHVHDRPLPLCARCMGIYLGVMTGLFTYAAWGRLRAGRLPRVRILLFLMLSGVAIGVDGLNSYFTLFDGYTPVYPPHNTLRLVTGMFAGLTMITVILPVFNGVAWCRPDPVPPLRSFKELAALVVLAAGVIAAVLIDLAALRWVLGLVSVAGVVIMFCIVGMVLFLTVTRRENTFTRWRDLALPALAGLAFAISVIGVIDAVRYTFTGTWGGFPFFE